MAELDRSPISFEDELLDPGPLARNRTESFRGLAEHWASKPLKHLRGSVHHKEVEGLIKLIWEDLFTLLRTGDIPINRIFSKHNDLHLEVYEYLRQAGSITPFEDACEWLRQNALRIPSVLIGFLGVEHIAEEFANDLRSKRKVENAKLDHDLNDLEALAHWFPYVDCAYTDTKMANSVFPRLRKAFRTKTCAFQLNAKRPLVFSKAATFLQFLQDLRPIEVVASLEGELKNGRGGAMTLLYLLLTPDPFISREMLEAKETVNAEILPGGGLRIDASQGANWDTVIATLRRVERCIPRDGNAATLVAIDWTGHEPLLCEKFLSFGTYLFSLDGLANRISAALHNGMKDIPDVTD